MVTTIGRQGRDPGLTAWVHSDFAGCVRTRKSTSGGVITVGRHVIKTWSSTQGAIALSSAEAEFYAMVEAVIKAKGLKTLAVEPGLLDLTNIIHLKTLQRATMVK